MNFIIQKFYAFGLFLILFLCMGLAQADTINMSCSLLDINISKYAPNTNSFKFHIEGNLEGLSNLPPPVVSSNFPDNSTYGVGTGTAGFIDKAIVQLAATDRNHSSKVLKFISTTSLEGRILGNIYDWDGTVKLFDNNLDGKLRVSRKVRCSVSKSQVKTNAPIPNEITVESLEEIFPEARKEVGICYPFIGKDGWGSYTMFTLFESIYSPLFFSYSNIAVPGIPSQPVFWWKRDGANYETTYGKSSDPASFSVRTRIAASDEYRNGGVFDLLAFGGSDLATPTHKSWSFQALFKVKDNDGLIAGDDLRYYDVEDATDNNNETEKMVILADAKNNKYTYFAKINYNGVKQYFTCNRAENTDILTNFKFNARSPETFPVKFKNDDILPIYSDTEIPKQGGVCYYDNGIAPLNTPVIEWASLGSEVKIKVTTGNLPHDNRVPAGVYNFVAHTMRDSMDKLIGRYEQQIKDIARNRTARNTAFFEHNDDNDPKFNDLDGLITSLVIPPSNDPGIPSLALWYSKRLYDIKRSEGYTDNIYDLYSRVTSENPATDIPQEYYTRAFRKPDFQKEVFGEQWILQVNSLDYPVRCTLKPVGDLWEIDRSHPQPERTLPERRKRSDEKTGE